MSTKRNRLDDVTMLFGFGMLLVVFGHSYPDFDSAAPGARWAYVLHHVIYAFHMPLFFFISGFLFFLTSRNREEPYGSFLWKKVKRLLVPYAVISTLAFPIKAAASRHAMHPVAFTWHDYVATLIFPWKNTIIFFWFLPTLFLIFCVAPLLRSAIRFRSPALRYAVGAALIAVNLCLPFRSEELLNWPGALHHFVYFFAGMLWCNAHPERIRFNASSFLVAAGVAIFGICFYCNVQETDWGRLLLALTGTGLSLWLVRPGVWTPALLLIGTYSFDIYLLSWFPQIACKILFYEKLGFWISLAAMFISGLLAPIAVARFFEKRWTKFGLVFGKA